MTVPDGAPVTSGLPKRQVGLAVAALTVGGALLRLPGLASRPLWMDEALSLGVATAPHPWVAIAADDLHPPLFALLLRGLAIVSHAEAWLRAPSFLASVLMIPLAWRAGRAWGRPNAGLVAATLVTVSPPLVVYAGEARPYALGAALVLAVLAATPGQSATALTVPAVLAMATLYGAWPVVLLACLAFAVRERGPARAVPLLVASCAAGSLGLTLMAAQRAAQGAALTDGKFAPWFWTFDHFPGWAARALPALPGWMWTGRADTLGWAAGVVAIAGITAVARTPGPRALDALTWAPVLGFAGLAGTGLHPFGPTRHLIVALPALIVWAAVRLDRRRPIVVLPWLVVAMGATALAPRPPFQDLPALLPQIDDLPVVADASAAWGARWYAPGAVEAMAWRTGPAFDEALGDRAPAGAFWFVATSTRPDAEIDLQRWATQAGRSLDRTVRVRGAWAIEVLPIR